jgi:hypothetical protein
LRLIESEQAIMWRGGNLYQWLPCLLWGRHRLLEHFILALRVQMVLATEFIVYKWLYITGAILLLLHVWGVTIYKLYYFFSQTLVYE